MSTFIPGGAVYGQTGTYEREADGHGRSPVHGRLARR